MNQEFDMGNFMIRTLPTPNPYALKFVTNLPFKREGKATFNSGDEAENMPLVRDLFSVAGVKQVYLFENTVSITHDGTLDNEELSDQVSAVIRTRMPLHNADFLAPDETLKARERVDKHHENPILQEIEEILDRTIRPGLQADGGDIEVVSLENNELKIVYQGACGGCPSSMMGTLDAIQGILRHELNMSELTVYPM
jgi:Fe-S cluster biogenesis protein NfuA